MFWFSREKRDSSGYKPDRASSEEINKAFEEHSEFLRWLAEVITGDPVIAEQCVTEARALTTKSSGVFRDWLENWARMATMQRAVEHIADEIGSASYRYAELRCVRGGHAPLTAEEFENLRDISPQELVAELDPFARAVLLLRSVQHCTTQDCSLRLGTVRSAVVGACCVLDQWFHARAPRSCDAIDDAPSPMFQDIVAPCAELSAWSSSLA